MRQIFWRLPSAVIATLLLGACAIAGDGNRTVFRSIEIVHGRFNQAAINVPAEKSIAFDVTLIGQKDVTVSIPALGVGATTVPANSVNPHSVKDSAAGNLRSARLMLGPLKPGEYQIVCDCPGQADIACLVVE